MLNINFKKEEGVTLVELLAAIAILSVIVTAFLAYFVQAAGTNNRTDKLNEATFLAQAEMEEVMAEHQIWNNELIDYVDAADNKVTKEVNGFNIVTKINKKKPETIDAEMYHVIVEVEEIGGNGSAQMETWLPLEYEWAKDPQNDN